MFQSGPAHRSRNFSPSYAEGKRYRPRVVQDFSSTRGRATPWLRASILKDSAVTNVSFKRI